MGNVRYNQYEVVLMITIGKEKGATRRPRGYRKPVNEFVTVIYMSFKRGVHYE